MAYSFIKQHFHPASLPPTPCPTSSADKLFLLFTSPTSHQITISFVPKHSLLHFSRDAQALPNWGLVTCLLPEVWSWSAIKQKRIVAPWSSIMQKSETRRIQLSACTAARLFESMVHSTQRPVISLWLPCIKSRGGYKTYTAKSGAAGSPHLVSGDRS